MVWRKGVLKRLVMRKGTKTKVALRLNLDKTWIPFVTYLYGT